MGGDGKSIRKPTPGEGRVAARKGSEVRWSCVPTLGFLLASHMTLGGFLKPQRPHSPPL